MTGGVVKLTAMSVHIAVFWLILVSVEGWTYHLHNKAMNWNEAREWCQKHYTDIVMVHNENVTNLLTKDLPSRSSSPYYWIGLKNINDSWTWVANGQIANYQNWGDKEPNSVLPDENCVEYISNPKNNGKWNDESCTRPKYPVCHKAQCLNNSCSDRGRCTEQVNNFTCECEPGFIGPRCEKVVTCEQLSAPPHGSMECSGLYGNHSLNSKCKFSCAGGYKLSGTAELQCNSSGAWNVPPPLCAAQCLNNSCSDRELCIEQVNNFTCVCKPGFSGPRCEKVVSCEQLSAPPHGWMECSGLYGNHSLNSKCTFSCADGYKLRGTAELQCTSSGAWNVPPPLCAAQCLNNSCSDRGLCREQVNNFTCECEPGFSGPRCEKVVSCEQLSAPPHGLMECSGLYGNHSLNSKCTFSCAGGYKLSGTAELRCNSSGAWNVPPPSCTAQCLKNSCSDRGLCIEQVNNFTCVCEPGFSGPHCEKVVSCEQLSAPPHGWMECSGLYGSHSLNSKCKFSCAGGYKLRGTAELQCNSSGAWNVPPPLCAVECFPLLLFGGGLMNCTEGHDSSRSTCRVECPPGHLLLGFAEFTCRADGMWESSFPLMCASFIHSLIALLSSVVISLFCGWFCCSKRRKSKKAVRMRTQQETLNPAFEAEQTPDGPLCSA